MTPQTHLLQAVKISNYELRIGGDSFAAQASEEFLEMRENE